MASGKSTSGSPFRIFLAVARSLSFFGHDLRDHLTLAEQGVAPGGCRLAFSAAHFSRVRRGGGDFHAPTSGGTGGDSEPSS